MKAGICHYEELVRLKRKGHWPWPNFEPVELVCRCGCGEGYFSIGDYNAIQRVRDELGKPLRINCAHRCALHNEAVGGAPRSQHLRMAFDISVRGWSGKQLARLGELLDENGFHGRGLYPTFVHADRRKKPARWISDGAERTARYL